MRCGGNSKPELRIALRTRSRLSRTLASGSPTIPNVGKPNDTSTSTWTTEASTPKTAAVRTHASMRGRVAKASAPRMSRTFADRAGGQRSAEAATRSRRAAACAGTMLARLRLRDRIFSWSPARCGCRRDGSRCGSYRRVVSNSRAIDESVSPRFTLYVSVAVAARRRRAGETVAAPPIDRDATVSGAAGRAVERDEAVGRRGITQFLAGANRRATDSWLASAEIGAADAELAGDASRSIRRAARCTTSATRARRARRRPAGVANGRRGALPAP